MTKIEHVKTGKEIDDRNERKDFLACIVLICLLFKISSFFVALFDVRVIKRKILLHAFFWINVNFMFHNITYH